MQHILFNKLKTGTGHPTLTVTTQELTRTKTQGLNTRTNKLNKITRGCGIHEHKRGAGTL